jgi:hypothetical protein
MAVAQAKVIRPARATYRGVLTCPERWSTWGPRGGDILVCTPPKCGTTWTQTMIAILLSGGPELPEQVSVLSPWVDADLGDASEVAAGLERQAGRRVVKTHTPADGFPVWVGVTVVAVYRHPLDVFFSLRKHALNMKARPDHPMRKPVSEALASFLSAPLDMADFDRDSLATVTHQYHETVLSDRSPDLEVFHYADMIADPDAALRRLAAIVGTEATGALIDRIASATGLNAMRAEAQRFVPEGGKGFWENDAAFFDTGGTEKWRGKVPDEDLALYRARLAELMPEAAARRWLEYGGGAVGEA